MKEIHTHGKIKSDSRSSVVELLRKEELQEKDFGQIYITTALPGATKGNHFHKDKHEWICVIRGNGIISLKDMEEEGKPRVFRGYGEKPSTVYVPPYMAHAIKNTSDE